MTREQPDKVKLFCLTSLEEMMPYILFFCGLLLLAYGGLWLSGRQRLREWHTQSCTYGSLAQLGERQVFYRLRGHGPVTVVFEAGLGTPSAEWWELQDLLASHAQVLTYDRAGYGWSTPSEVARTPNQIAQELAALLEYVGLNTPLILVGHSQGGLYVHQFVRNYPHMVAGVVLLDPRSPQNARFQQQLSPPVYRRSGVDKTAGIGALLWLSQVGFLRLMKAMILKSPPFFYYKTMAPPIREVIWGHLLQPHSARVALDEDRQAQTNSAIAPLLDSATFPQVPLTVLAHDSATIIDELVRYAGLTPAEAQQVETVWQQLLYEHTQLSDQSRWIEVVGASHFMHQDQPEAVLAAIHTMIAQYPITKERMHHEISS
jgi:pimeloyl-ACP methyl ester carboxylesterase